MNGQTHPDQAASDGDAHSTQVQRFVDRYAPQRRPPSVGAAFNVAPMG